MSEFIERIKSEVIISEQRLRLLKELLQLEEGNLSQISQPHIKKEESSTMLIKSSPVNKRGRNSDVGDIVKKLLESEFTSATRMPDIQKKYNEKTGRTNIIENVIRRLRSEGFINSVQYNGSNWSVYWGLTSWIDNTKQDFKPEYRPSVIDTNATSEIIK